jgi:hypothetical protein
VTRLSKPKKHHEPTDAPSPLLRLGLRASGRRTSADVRVPLPPNEPRKTTTVQAVQDAVFDEQTRAELRNVRAAAAALASDAAGPTFDTRRRICMDDVVDEVAAIIEELEIDVTTPRGAAVVCFLYDKVEDALDPDVGPGLVWPSRATAALYIQQSGRETGKPVALD